METKEQPSEPIVELYVRSSINFRSIGAVVPLIVKFPEGGRLYVQGYNETTDKILEADPCSYVVSRLQGSFYDDSSKHESFAPGEEVVYKIEELQKYVKFKLGSSNGQQASVPKV